MVRQLSPDAWKTNLPGWSRQSGLRKLLLDLRISKTHAWNRFLKPPPDLMARFHRLGRSIASDCSWAHRDWAANCLCLVYERRLRTTAYPCLV